MTTIRSEPGGGESHSACEIDTAVLTIGRGTDQQVHVPDFHVALQHARLIALEVGRFQLEVLSANGIVVNRRRRQDCRVSIGDVIELGATQMAIESAPDDFDLALAVRRTEMQSDTLDRQARRIVPGSGMAIRIMSWMLFLLVLTAGLGLPMTSHFQPEIKPLLAALFLPGTSIWSPGPLTSAHEHFGHDCAACHQHPFQPVADGSCKSCHAEVPLHLPSLQEGLVDPAAQRCESCHLEHNGAIGLSTFSQAFCVECHQDTSAFTGAGSSPPAITDFADKHPPFNVSLSRKTENGGFSTLRLPLKEARGAEQSNLLFPHDVHLAVAGVKAPGGDVVLACQDCHQLSEAAGLMTAISFQTHCSACHQLAFDLSAPEREVPHGNPTVALQVLSEFYAQLALRGSSAEVPIEVLHAANPDTSLQWARTQARVAATALFEDRACMQCHEVQSSESDNTLSWEIPAVYLKRPWFPAARFDHTSHLITSCDDCHDARSSKFGNDILIPDINTCRNCHGGESATHSLTSTCLSCHRFHGPVRRSEGGPRPASIGTLILQGFPDLEQAGRVSRGMDSRRQLPGDRS